MVEVFKLIKWGRILVVIFVCITLNSCIDPFEIETENFENILVINATITNEVKNQEILLSRTFRFEDDGPLSEEGATVKVIEDASVEYTFEESSPGIYRSVQEFAASSGKEYELSIQTSEGRSYVSDKVTLPQETSIERIYPQKITNNNGVEGLGIFVDTFDPTGNSKYYRYEFEETYRIITPLWYPFDLIVTSEGENSFEFGLVNRPENQKICYASNVSNNIKIANTTIFEEDRITGLEVNFIPAEDIRVDNRYSILVRQYVQSREANGFYEILSSFSESESLFSQIQPGFITGNIISENNQEEKVLGYFDVSSVSEQRIFVNRDDFLIDLPRFALECDLIELVKDPFDELITFHQRIGAFIDSNEVRYFPDAPPEPGEPIEFPGILSYFVPRACGDCTALGVSTAPGFWVD
ncbi:DUF4249 domain-containing protein [uncultured Aquimarina sp.]|uniref:DUF4249 domain-containing protein n=1 Tax=uncultured Aquimarina sp. TaxID=575652 RepID=UPI00260459D6|nr:DUF4249 domain-containing protein [uncultured Aquimarina sp.]